MNCNSKGGNKHMRKLARGKPGGMGGKNIETIIV